MFLDREVSRSDRINRLNSLGFQSLVRGRGIYYRLNSFVTEAPLLYIFIFVSKKPLLYIIYDILLTNYFRHKGTASLHIYFRVKEAAIMYHISFQGDVRVS